MATDAASAPFSAVPQPDARARLWALGGVVLVGAGALAVLALHVLAPEVDPVRRTVSQYALGPWKPVFDAGVI